MMTLLLVRHGLTNWNVEHRYLGHSDPPLNATGEQQAQRLSLRLRDQPLDAVYSSDSQRALQTARSIGASRALAIHADERLREMNFGLFEGLTYEAIQAQYPSMAASWFADPECPPTGGERLREMAARVKIALDEIIDQSAKTCLLVAHGGSLRMILCHLLGLPAEQHWRFELKPCAITQINVYDSGGILVRLNDDSHLEETA